MDMLVPDSVRRHLRIRSSFPVATPSLNNKPVRHLASVKLLSCYRMCSRPTLLESLALPRQATHSSTKSALVCHRQDDRITFRLAPLLLNLYDDCNCAASRPVS
jgi:hypothetical protein